MTLLLITEPNNTLLLVEDFELLTIDEQTKILRDAENIRYNENEFFDLYRQTAATEGKWTW